MVEDLESNGKRRWKKQSSLGAQWSDEDKLSGRSDLEASRLCDEFGTARTKASIPNWQAWDSTSTSTSDSAPKANTIGLHVHTTDPLLRTPPLGANDHAFKNGAD